MIMLKINESNEKVIINKIIHSKKSLFDNSVIKFLDNLNKQYELKNKIQGEINGKTERKN